MAHVVAWNSRRNGGRASGCTSSSNCGKIGRRVSSLWAEMPVERDLCLCTDRAPNSVPADQHHESGAGIHRFLQTLEPQIPFADALVVFENGHTGALKFGAE